MFKTSDTSPSDADSPGEGSGLEVSESSSVSDRDSNNSRDVNLNSKKFADCNLVGGSREESERRELLEADRPAEEGARRGDESPSGESGVEGEGVSPRHENLPPSQGNNAGSGNSPDSRERRKNAASVANSSTPKPGSTGTQLMSDLFSISLDGSLPEQETNGQTFLVSASTLGPSSSLTNEEIGKRFQDLSFAFKTDSTTIQNRLHLMKRRRDQAETNIENELKTIKAKLRSLQYLGLNSEFVNLMSDLKKQLDFVLNATVQLSSSAEGYGYAQHEERLLEFVTVMLQHVENVESLKNEASKILEKLKVEGNGPLPSTSLDYEDRILRRRCASAAAAAESASRRRASIATLPRASSISENGSDGRGSPWPLCGRPLLGKKLSFSQGSPSRSHGNGSPPRDDGRRDSLGSRHRTESRQGEGLMKDIEEFPERQPSAAESEAPEDALDADSSNVDLADSSFHLRQLFESLEEIRRSSVAQESVGAVHCIRKIIEWNKLLISATRFRWPDNVLHYVPFYVTWYVVFVLALVFVGGLFTGINGCYTYSCCKSSLLWFGVLTFLCLTRRFYRFLLPLFFAFLLALILLFLWLTQILLPQLSNEETEKLLRRFGFALEIRYPHGPPPI